MPPNLHLLSTNVTMVEISPKARSQQVSPYAGASSVGLRSPPDSCQLDGHRDLPPQKEPPLGCGQGVAMYELNKKEVGGGDNAASKSSSVTMGAIPHKARSPHVSPYSRASSVALKSRRVDDPSNLPPRKGLLLHSSCRGLTMFESNKRKVRGGDNAASKSSSVTMGAIPHKARSPRVSTYSRVSSVALKSRHLDDPSNLPPRKGLLLHSSGRRLTMSQESNKKMVGDGNNASKPSPLTNLTMGEIPPEVRSPKVSPYAGASSVGLQSPPERRQLDGPRDLQPRKEPPLGRGQGLAMYELNKKRVGDGPQDNASKSSSLTIEGEIPPESRELDDTRDLPPRKEAPLGYGQGLAMHELKKKKIDNAASKFSSITMGDIPLKTRSSHASPYSRAPSVALENRELDDTSHLPPRKGALLASGRGNPAFKSSSITVGAIPRKARSPRVSPYSRATSVALQSRQLDDPSDLPSRTRPQRDRGRQFAQYEMEKVVDGDNASKSSALSGGERYRKGLSAQVPPCLGASSLAGEKRQPEYMSHLPPRKRPQRNRGREFAEYEMEKTGDGDNASKSSAISGGERFPKGLSAQVLPCSEADSLAGESRQPEYMSHLPPQKRPQRDRGREFAVYMLLVPRRRRSPGVCRGVRRQYA